jgi:hypothetical protein
VAQRPVDEPSPRFEVERRGDGWAVVTAAGAVVSEHALKVSAMAERQRLLETDGDTAAAEEGAYPDNVGG